MHGRHSMPTSSGYNQVRQQHSVQFNSPFTYSHQQIFSQQQNQYPTYPGLYYQPHAPMIYQPQYPTGIVPTMLPTPPKNIIPIFNPNTKEFVKFENSNLAPQPPITHAPPAPVVNKKESKENAEAIKAQFASLVAATLDPSHHSLRHSQSKQEKQESNEAAKSVTPVAPFDDNTSKQLSTEDKTHDKQTTMQQEHTEEHKTALEEHKTAPAHTSTHLQSNIQQDDHTKVVKSKQAFKQPQDTSVDNSQRTAPSSIEKNAWNVERTKSFEVTPQMTTPAVATAAASAASAAAAAATAAAAAALPKQPTEVEKSHKNVEKYPKQNVEKYPKQNVEKIHKTKQPQQQQPQSQQQQQPQSQQQQQPPQQQQQQSQQPPQQQQAQQQTIHQQQQQQTPSAQQQQQQQSQQQLAQKPHPQQQPLQQQPQQAQQPPQQPPPTPPADDQGSEWQESKRNRKKKQQPHKQLKATSSNGVKPELTKQSSNPLPSQATPPPPTTQTSSHTSNHTANQTSNQTISHTANQTSNQTSSHTSSQPSKPTAVVWPSKPSENYKSNSIAKTVSPTTVASTPAEAKNPKYKTPEAKVAQHKQIHHKQGEHKSADHKHVQHKQVEHKPLEHKVSEHKTLEHKQVEQKTVEHKPEEQKPVEQKPVEHKSEQKPVEHKLVEHKSEQKPVEHKPVEHKSEHKPVEHKPVEHKPVEHKTVEHKPVEHKTVEQKPVEHKTVEQKPVEQKTVEQKPVEQKPVIEHKAVSQKPPEMREFKEVEMVAAAVEVSKEVKKKKEEEVKEEEKKEQEEEVIVEGSKDQGVDKPDVASKEDVTQVAKSDVEDDTKGGEGAEGVEEEELKEDEVLKSLYEKDQWSPSNPSGRKVYNRAFLLYLQFTHNLPRPNLPPLEIVLSQPITERQDLDTTICRPDTSSFGNFARPMSMSQNRAYANKRPNNQNIAKRQYSNEQGRRVINLSLQRDVVLHTSDNAWNKTKIESDETKVMGKKFRAILNKLTPERYHSLARQAMELKISTEQQLMTCIDILFEKAILEPLFAILYAQLTKELSNLKVPKDENNNEMVTFKVKLLMKVQSEFHKDKEEEKEIMLLCARITEATDEEEQKSLAEQLETARWKFKKRSLGNIKFIGELFKFVLLTEKIIHDCLSRLLNQSDDEDSLECLCQLFITVGQSIDKKGENLKHINRYFNTLQTLVNEKKTCPRIRFMILNVIDLRKNNWNPRHDNNPKTIDQIHKEARMENLEKQQRIVELGQRRKFEEPYRPHQKVLTVQDGWSNITKPPKSTYDASKLKLTKAGVDENTKLGPPRGGWSKGSVGGSTQSSVKPIENKRTANRFSLLSLSMEGAERGEAPSSNESIKHVPHNKSLLLSASQEKPSVPTESAHKAHFGASQSVTLGRKGGSGGKKMSEEEVEKKTKIITDEFLHTKDLEEVFECLRTELHLKEDWNNAMFFFYHSLILNVDRSVQAREQIGGLHRNVLLKHLVPAPCCYSVAVRKLVAFAEDAIIDIPQVWEYIGQIVCPIFLENSNLPLSMLIVKSSDRVHYPDEQLDGPHSDAPLLATVLNGLKHHLGHFTAKEIWEASDLKWNKLISPDKLKDFIKKHGLEYTEDTQQGGRRHRLVSVNEDKNKLIELYKKPGATIEEVQDWIHEFMYISSAATSNPNDLKSTADVCSALCMATLKKVPNTDVEYDLDEESFKSFLCVVRTYTTGRHDRQLALLNGLQELIHRLEHPPNILHRIFELLLDAEVVNEAAFHQWHDATSNSPGKGMALQSVTRFFNWLKEEEKDNVKN